MMPRKDRLLNQQELEDAVTNQDLYFYEVCEAQDRKTAKGVARAIWEECYNADGVVPDKLDKFLMELSQ